MAREWYDLNSYLSLGIDWQASVHTTYVDITILVYRWDQYETYNSGGRFDEALNPDANNGMRYMEWTDFGFTNGSGTREEDHFDTRRYYRGTSDTTVAFTLWWRNIGTAYGGSFHSLGSGNHTWYLTIPKLDQWTVSYDANGGTPTPSSQTKQYNAALTLTSTKPTRTDAIFNDWGLYRNSWSYYQSGASYTENAAATFKARWIPQLHITFDANGGTGAPQKATYTAGLGNITPDTDLSTVTKTVTLPSTEPTRARYRFLGWARDKNATEPDYRAGEVLQGNTDKGDLTLYAVWKLLVSDINISGSTTLGGTVNVRTTKVSSAYVDVVTYQVRNSSYSGTVSMENDSGSVNSILDWANASPNSASVTVRFTVETFASQGGDSFGTASVDYAMTIPNNASTRPSISGLRIHDLNDYDAEDEYGAFIQGYSQFKVSPMSCETKFGATIASMTYSIASDSGFTNVLDTVVGNNTNYITFDMAKTTQTAGDRYVRVVIVDSRGFSTTYIYPNALTVVPYEKPTLTGLSSEYFQNEQANPIRLTYAYTMSYSFSDIGEKKNKLSETIRYRLYDSQSSAWQTALTKPDINEEEASGTYTELDVHLDANRHYMISVEITDAFGNSASAQVELITSSYKPIIDLYRNTGVSLGKVASEEGLTLGEATDPWDLNIGSEDNQNKNLLYRNAESRTVEFMDLPLPITEGGTGETTIEGIREALGITEPTVLYDNAAGYNGNITLTESVADYDYIRVYFFISRDGTVTYASTDVYEPNGKTVSLFGTRNATYNSRFHYGGATYSISNSTMTLVSSGVADSSGSVDGAWNTYIYRVEAWSGGASIGFGGSGGGGGGGGSQFDLLWTNPNPTSNFAAQTLSGIPWQNYKFLLIDHYTAGNGNVAAHYQTSVISTDNPSDWSWITCIREVPFGRGVKFPANNQVQFGSQTYYDTYNGANATLYDDWQFIVPTKIWGVKQGGSIGTATDVLYADDSGTTGTVTLSKSAANYDHMRIYFRYIDDDFYSSVDVYSPNGKTVQLSVSETTSWNGWLIGRAVVISGTSITTHNGNNYGEGKVNGDAEWNNVNKIAITRVEAWNDGGGTSGDVDWTISTYSGGWYMRRGKFVSVHCESYGAFNAPKGTYSDAVFTLPEGFRPHMPANTEIRNAASPLGGSSDPYYAILPNGEVKVGAGTAATTYWCFDVTFPCE